MKKINIVFLLIYYCIFFVTPEIIAVAPEEGISQLAEFQLPAPPGPIGPIGGNGHTFLEGLLVVLITKAFGAGLSYLGSQAHDYCKSASWETKPN